MALVLKCSCGKSLQVDEQHRGKKIRCPACNQVTTVPAANVDAANVDAVRADMPPPHPPDLGDKPAQSERKAAARPPATRTSTVPWIVAGCAGVIAVFSCMALAGAGLLYLGQQGNNLAKKAVAGANEVEKKQVEEKRAREERRQSQQQSKKNLQAIALAVHDYHDANKRLPHYAMVHPKTKEPLLSWRVAILPYLDERELFEAFRHDEPWNSPHNQSLWKRMPKIYRLPGMENDGTTHYQVLLSDEPVANERRASFDKLDLRRTLVGITDGSSNTILMVEAARAVNWAKPEDVPFQYQPGGFTVQSLGDHWQDDTFHAAFADAVARRVPRSISPLKLQAAITCNGHETIKIEEFDADRPGPPNLIQLKEQAQARIGQVNERCLILFFDEQRYPENLLELTKIQKGDSPLLDPVYLRDPWGKELLFDRKGPRNLGKRPDIWTIAPDGEIIGNFPKGR